MNSITWIAFLVLMGAVFMGRYFSEKSYTQLTTEEKGRVMESFAGLRKFSLVPIIGLLGIYYILAVQMGVTSSLLYLLYLGLILVYALGTNLFVYRKIKAIQPKREFVRMQMLGRLVPIIGLLVFMGMLYLPDFNR